MKMQQLFHQKFEIPLHWVLSGPLQLIQFRRQELRMGIYIRQYRSTPVNDGFTGLDQVLVSDDLDSVYVEDKIGSGKLETLCSVAF